MANQPDNEGKETCQRFLGESFMDEPDVRTANAPVCPLMMLRRWVVFHSPKMIYTLEVKSDPTVLRWSLDFMIVNRGSSLLRLLQRHLLKDQLLVY